MESSTTQEGNNPSVTSAIYSYFDRILIGFRRQFNSNSPVLCDVELYFSNDPEPIRTHSVILMSIAPFWTDVFKNTDMDNSNFHPDSLPFSVIMPDMDKSMVRSFLSKLYRGNSFPKSKPNTKKRNLFIPVTLDIIEAFQIQQCFSVSAENESENDEYIGNDENAEYDDDESEDESVNNMRKTKNEIVSQNRPHEVVLNVATLIPEQQFQPYVVATVADQVINGEGGGSCGDEYYITTADQLDNNVHNIVHNIIETSPLSCTSKKPIEMFKPGLDGVLVEDKRSKIQFSRRKEIINVHSKRRQRKMGGLLTDEQRKEELIDLQRIVKNSSKKKRKGPLGVVEINSTPAKKRKTKAIKRSDDDEDDDDDDDSSELDKGETAGKEEKVPVIFDEDLLCRFCGVRKLTGSAYGHHLLTHKNFTCPWCKYRSNGIDPYEDHIKRFHGGRMQCPECESQFESFVPLKRHLIQEHAEDRDKKFVCKLCHKRFSIKYQLTSHLSRSHNSHIPFVCLPCDQGFASTVKLKDHKVEVHHERIDKNTPDVLKQLSDGEIDSQIALGCGICEERDFKDINLLEKHILSMHSSDDKDKDKVVCEFCGKSLANKYEARNHVIRKHSDPAENKTIKCSDCPRTFALKADLKTHYWSSHLNPDGFPCSVCDKNFSSLSSLNSHKVRVHKIGSVSWLGEYPCQICGKIFADAPGLFRHSASVHASDDEKTFACKLCEKKFALESLLKSHCKQTHENAGKFKCEICSKQMNSRAAIDLHRKRIHREELLLHGGIEETEKESGEPEENLFCHICGKRFSSKYSAKSHVDRVHGDNKFKCQFCEKTFAEKTRLKNHISSIHVKSFPYSCTKCSRSFNTRNSYGKHFRRHHAREGEGMDISIMQVELGNA